MVKSSLLQKLLVLLPLAYPSDIKAPESEWSYANTGDWGVNFPQCDGNRQSPIHLRRAASYALPIPPIRFDNYATPLAANANLTNNGHSVEFPVAETTNRARPLIRGGNLPGAYEAVGVHFHWGSSNSKGSEHVINNQRFDAEIHIVHKNVRYSTVEQASRYRDGLAVLGVMLKIVDQPDRIYPGLNRVFNQLQSVIRYRSSATVSGRISLNQMLGDLNTKRFFTYSGSLTTPNCAEAVTWFVFPQALPIARERIRRFWAIQDSNGNALINNFRPLQNRNRRPVFYRAIRN